MARRNDCGWAHMLEIRDLRGGYGPVEVLRGV